MRSDRAALVIGGAGFVGGYLVRDLIVAGYSVTVFGRRAPGPVFAEVVGKGLPAVRVAIGDIHDAEQLAEVVRSAKPAVIVHLAATADIALLNQQPAIGLRDFTALFGALRAAHEGGARRFISFSSTSALTKRQYEPIDARHPVILPDSGPAGGMYGAFKAAGEVVGLTFSAVFGLDVRIVRAQSVYGFGMRAPIPVRLMVEGAVAGLPVHLPSGGTFPRDHTHVDDVSSLTMALVRAEGPIDRVFIPGTGRPPTTGSDVAAVVRELVPGCDVTISDAMTDAELADSVYRGRVSIENARVQLDWQPRFPDLRDGVADYIERYRRFVARGGDPTQSMETAR